MKNGLIFILLALLLVTAAGRDQGARAAIEDTTGKVG
jgi:hypothetical protein